MSYVSIGIPDCRLLRVKVGFVLIPIEFHCEGQAAVLYFTLQGLNYRLYGPSSFALKVRLYSPMSLVSL